MRKFFSVVILMSSLCLPVFGTQQYKDTLIVAKDGTGDYDNVTDALEGIRAYMDYTVTVMIKSGVYKEKIVIPSWLWNVEFVGEDADNTVITYDDHANINRMGTFRTYTLKVEGCMLTFRNLTIENNAPQLGQAVALHTEGDKLKFFNCRLLGNQDTVFTGHEGARIYFKCCYIEGTTDFIFGPATVLFDECIIHSKKDSYITASSTPKGIKVGYVFRGCKLTADRGVKKVFLGRPWRPYAATVFIDCDMDEHICPSGWDNWRNPMNERTARYAEYNSKGMGGHPNERVKWSRQLDEKEARLYYDLSYIFSVSDVWLPY